MEKTRETTIFSTHQVKRDSSSNRVERPCLDKKKSSLGFKWTAQNTFSSPLLMDFLKNIKGDIAEGGSGL